MSEAERDINARLVVLSQTVERAKRRWFFMGVVCGIVGVYLGQILGA